MTNIANPQTKGDPTNQLLPRCHGAAGLRGRSAAGVHGGPAIGPNDRYTSEKAAGNCCASGWVTVRCISVGCGKMTDLAGGGKVLFRCAHNGIFLTYHLRPVSRGGMLDLQNLCFGLDWPYEIGQKVDGRRLEGRFTEILVRREVRHGRSVPIIKGFRQSPRQWFSWTGNGHAR